MGDSDTEVNLDEITDESLLQNLLDQTEDIDDRKAIRNRIQELRSSQKAQREDRLNKLVNTREDMLQKRKREAEEQKQRTLQMYDRMAKSSPAGGSKVMDIGLYRNADGTSPPPKPAGAFSGLQKDGVEDAMRDRQREAENRKKRILAAYEAAAKAGPAGTIREVNFEAFSSADVSGYTPPKTTPSSTFEMVGGIPKVTKVNSNPGTPLSPGFPGGINFPSKADDSLDSMERALRARQKEAEERKLRTLTAYDIIAKQGAGPKIVCLEEFRDIQVPKDIKLGTNYSGTTSFRAGLQQQH